jgi:hypothetical protein
MFNFVFLLNTQCFSESDRNPGQCTNRNLSWSLELTMQIPELRLCCLYLGRWENRKSSGNT